MSTSIVKNKVSIDNITIRMMRVLQSTLELEKLISLFHHELTTVVQYDHLAYENQSEKVRFNIGDVSTYKLSYELKLQDNSMGVLLLSSDKKFTETERNKIGQFIPVLNHPLRNALLYKQALSRAYIDPLTGVNNRTAFEQSITREIELAKRYDQPISVMMVDVDNFKQINDNYGHLVGDAVLKDFSDCFISCIRSSDIIFRYGGEEFIILLRNTHIPGARLLADRMRKSVSGIKIEHDGSTFSTSVSIGLTALRNKDNSVEVVARADRLLYEAKQNGRNQIVTDSND